MLAAPLLQPAQLTSAILQVVLAKHKKIPGKYMALKVVFMQNPDLDEEHKAVMRG